MHSLSNRFVLPGSGKTVFTGWLPPTPDVRDYTERHPKIAEITRKLPLKAREDPLPDKMDLREWFTPVEDQGNLGSCTANAAAGVIEYFEARSFGEYEEASRLFIYKTTRNLMQTTGDSGAWLRTAMGAVAMCGVPQERYWSYTDKDPDFDLEPPAFVYSIAKKYQALRYFCHDPVTSSADPALTLESVKKYIAAGIPAMFGFYGFSSFNWSDGPGHIPFPCKGEIPQWGHAVVAAGYDDNKTIVNLKCGAATTGALLIRNSWGTGWGDQGYGWLPYAYVLNRLASDFWSLLSLEWIDTDQFGFLV